MIAIKMKALLEKIGSSKESINVRYFPNEGDPEPRYPWHYHEEIELLYVRGGQGERFVGNHLSIFQDGDLVLIGSNVPHAGFANEETQHEAQTVVQLSKVFFENGLMGIPEFEPIKALFSKALLGISIGGDDKYLIGAKLESMKDAPKLDRVVLILEILNDILKSSHQTVLNKRSSHIKTDPNDNHRIQLIYNFIEKNFRDNIMVADIASKLELSDSAFCRYFKKTTGNTFSNFLNEYRITYACKLIQQSNDSFRDIAFLCGYNNFSYFFRVFKKVVGSSPSVYKKSLQNFWNKDR